MQSHSKTIIKPSKTVNLSTSLNVEPSVQIKKIIRPNVYDKNIGPRFTGKNEFQKSEPQQNIEVVTGGTPQSFQSLNLPQVLLTALNRIGFNDPTPIQQTAIPVALKRQDVIATAQTGTGKTASFCLPIAAHLLQNPHAKALVLVPTRELAIQISDFWLNLTRGMSGLSSCVLIGGLPFSKQANQVRKNPSFIIATPGRLVDHLEQRTLQLSKVESLVLDEADRMLDMGFAPQLSKILKVLPIARHNMLFSATWTPDLDGLVQGYLKNPIRIAVGNTSQAARTIEQLAFQTSGPKKNDVLLDKINEFGKGKTSMLIFARTKSRTDRLAKFLFSYGLSVDRLHGGRTQGQRTNTMRSFRDGRIQILVATDIAARGIDVSEIQTVINYDLPECSEDYIHRIGRTGRAGVSGRALSLLTPEDKSNWNDICRLLKKSGSNVPTVQLQN